jgi:hypothetical protein
MVIPPKSKVMLHGNKYKVDQHHSRVFAKIKVEYKRMLTLQGGY